MKLKNLTRKKKQQKNNIVEIVLRKLPVVIDPEFFIATPARVNLKIDQ